MRQRRPFAYGSGYRRAAGTHTEQTATGIPVPAVIVLSIIGGRIIKSPATPFRKLRIETGLSGGDFGANLRINHGTSASHWYRIERGEIQPTTKTLVGIAEELANRLPGRTTLGVLGELLELESYEP